MVVSGIGNDFLSIDIRLSPFYIKISTDDIINTIISSPAIIKSNVGPIGMSSAAAVMNLILLVLNAYIQSTDNNACLHYKHLSIYCGQIFSNMLGTKTTIVVINGQRSITDQKNNCDLQPNCCNQPKIDH